MSFDIAVDRAQFPVTVNLIYLNHAAVAPLPRPAGEAMEWCIRDSMNWGSSHYLKWIDAIEGVRGELSTMIGCATSEVALIKNTSEGIATVQMGISWKAGDIVVAFREEFPANYYCWKLLEKRHGCEVRWLSIYDPLEAVEKACQGARLLAISWVNYLSGFRVDLKAIGEICKRCGVFFFVDAIQGLGALPLDVKECEIDALAADGHKWLLGPEGWGVLYIARHRQDEVFPAEFGWTTVKNWTDYASRDMTLRDDARRYEPGTLNVVGSFGLRASMGMLNQFGIENVRSRTMGLANRLASGLEELGADFPVERAAANASAIVSCRFDGHDSQKLATELARRNIIGIQRQGWLRFSPHYYLEMNEMDTVLNALRESLKEGEAA